ncbi:MAG TPA: glycosyltransferase family 4 protein [Panacibacter sp.]|nr:glycosyltransferase family 4 protein [Panacibacter sp.]
MKRIIFTVTNDLTYDQRMQRICTSLAANGFEVMLVGRKLKTSLPLAGQLFKQKRLRCFFNKGFFFYAEYNKRLFFWLLFQKVDIVCAIDLDTILSCYAATAFRSKQRVYDAHELFTEQKEIVTRPAVHQLWLAVEKFAVPKFKKGYTVNQFIAGELQRRYGVDYGIVRNLPVLVPLLKGERLGERPFIIYQGAVNEGRSFETLIPAMQHVNATLKIFGKGNFFEQVKQLIKDYKVEDKVELMGFVIPQELKQITPTAYVAVTLFEQTGLNQFYSLSNRFFDYIMAGVPQVCVNYPEYKTINDAHNIALMIDDTKIATIADALNRLLNDKALHEHLQQNCVNARNKLNWQEEEKVLIEFYKKLSPG